MLELQILLLFVNVLYFEVAFGADDHLVFAVNSDGMIWVVQLVRFYLLIGAIGTCEGTTLFRETYIFHIDGAFTVRTFLIS